MGAKNNSCFEITNNKLTKKEILGLTNSQIRDTIILTEPATLSHASA